MKFKDYLSEINKLVIEKPEILEMDTYYASDDEGNGFEEVYHTPSIMLMNGYEEPVSEEDDPEDLINCKKVIVVN
jgi:hypothetical protein